jgi:hypothetical protein
LHWIAALLVGATLIGTASFTPVRPAQAADEKKDKNTVSKPAAKPLKAAQDAIAAKKYSDALPHLKEVENLPSKTPYDEFVMNQMYAYVYAHTNQLAEAEKPLEAVLNSSYTPQSEIPDRVKTLMKLNYQLKNYDKAIEFGQRAIKGGFADDDVYTFTVQAYYLKNDYKNTQKLAETYVDSEIKAGKTPKEDMLQLIQSSCLKLDDEECLSRTLEKLVTYHPKTEYWQNVIYTILKSPSLNDKALLNTFRLASEVDVLKRPEDYTEMAQLAIEAGSPGEAQRILEKGFQKNVFPDARSQDKNKRLLESAKKAADADLASLPKIAADADSAPTGDKDVGVGLAYLGYQQYDKAVDALSKGVSKGGLKNEAEARLLLGIAQLKAGHKDDAVKAFRSVKGDPSLERLANLWSLHAKQA